MKKTGSKIKFKSVEVIWNDASSNSETWVSVADISAPEQVNTCGWLVRDTPDYITVASSVSADGRDDDIVGNTMTIPRGMIVTIKELRSANARSSTQHNLRPEPGAKTVHREPSESGPVLK